MQKQLSGGPYGDYARHTGAATDRPNHLGDDARDTGRLFHLSQVMAPRIIMIYGLLRRTSLIRRWRLESS
jgi:hypothetical protein